MLIPFERLTHEALVGLIESFVVREGTDYGEHEWSFEEKVGMLMAKIKSGDVCIVYDETLQEVNLLAREQVPSSLK